jgi:alanyl-tRNA synthetase
LQEQVKESEKARRKLALEAAGFRGRALYEECAADERGRKVRLDRRASGPLDDETRAVAVSFCAQPKAVYIAAADQPPSVLLAASADSGIHPGNTLKELLQAAGGRGGGNAQTAQGSVPSKDALDAILNHLAQL